MDLQKQKIKEVYSQFAQKINQLFGRKKTLIDDFRRKLETKKINKIRDEINK